MDLISLHEREQIRAYLSRDRALHVYEIGDLDPFFWPRTVWYGLSDAAAVQALALLYIGVETPVLLAVSRSESAALQALAERLAAVLPARLYAHLAPWLLEPLSAHYHIADHGTYHKMALTDTASVGTVDTSAVEQLTPAHEQELLALYAHSYPANSFDPRMLHTGHYYGVRRDGRLACSGGVHVYAPDERVAALGNITTAPEQRGQGLATQVVAALCQRLLREVDAIGLNVSAANSAAQRCYTRLGFSHIADYNECTLERKR